MKIVSQILLFAVAVLCIARYTDGCSCAFAHPQDTLCRERTFAALVKVRSAEYVYFTRKPKNPESNSQNSTNDRLMNDAAADFGDVSYQNENQDDTEKVEIVLKKEEYDMLSAHRFIIGHKRYRVKVYDTFKGLKQEEVTGKKVYIYTAPHDSLCGLQLKEKEMYLLIGSVQEDNTLSIGLCNYHVHWNSLDMKQKRAIRRNMRAAKETCKSDCSVDFCYGNCAQSKNSCVWTSHLDRISYKLKIDPANYACTREYGKQDARCVWNNELDDGKRGRRRRRNHSSGSRSRSLKSHRKS